MSDEPADAGELPAGDMPEAEGQEAPAQDPVAEEAPAAEDTGAVAAEEPAAEADEAQMAEQPAAEPIEGSADGTSPLEPELDPTAEELGPTDVAELQASGFKVDEEVAQAAGFPAEGAEGYAPAEGEQPYLEADPQGYPMMPQEGGEYVPAEGYPGQDAYGADYGQYPGAEGGYDPAMYAAAVAGDPGAGAPGDAAGAPGQAYTEQLLAQEREKHEAQLQVEAKAREELEDMILRIEKHFKAEQAARKKAEELLQASIAAEMESKSKVEEVLKKRAQEQRMLEEERAAIKRERMALESMRQEFEGELQAARSEVSKAQEALASSEERIRATEQVERARLEADYQARLASMSQEVERMREELGYRTMVMSAEMEKWRQQAALTATAVMEAKNDVLERKKELDHTKEKMDKLLEKLYIGRERGMELSGAIASNQRMMQYMPAGMFMGAAGSLKPGAPMQAWAAAHGAGVKLPPLAKQQSHAPHAHTLHHVPHQHEAPVAAGFISDDATTHPVSARRGAGGRDVSPPGYITASHSEGHVIGAEGSNPNYAHVQSKFARDAAEKSMAAKAKARARSGRTGAKARPDRFAEADRDNQRLAAMGRRWN